MLVAVLVSCGGLARKNLIPKEEVPILYIITKLSLVN